jgi:hypothetical protein
MTTKNSFLLKGISHQAIIEKYSLFTQNQINISSSKSNVTCISAFSSVDKGRDSGFIDKKYIITMIDLFSKSQLPETTDLACFWCRHPFRTTPIGCPLKFVPSQYEKKYFSEITKDKYNLLHNISQSKREELKEEKSDNIIVKDYYESDGVFCSFNCCIAFINDNSHNSMYTNSRTLLLKLYSDLYGYFPTTGIPPAPHWRLLSVYGGKMSIVEFREKFNVVTYEVCNKLREIPISKVTGWVFEEREVEIKA